MTDTYRICLINRPGVYYFRDPLKGAIIQDGRLFKQGRLFISTTFYNKILYFLSTQKV